MILHLTVGVAATGSDTRVTAVVVEAGKAAGAFMIILTISTLAESIGIALVSSWTFTLSLTATGKAFSTWSARVGITWVWLFNAAGNGIRLWYVTWQTFADRVAQPVHITLSVGTARTGEAWIRRWGSGLNFGTACDCIRLRLEPGQAGAHRIALEVDITFCVGSTRCWLARIWSRHTLVILADIISVAITVNLAFSAAASNGIRLGHIGGQTTADRVAGWQDRALSVGATWRGVARIRFYNALVILANVTSTTIRITFTFAFASSNCIRHWDEARQTTADRVAKAVLHAHGVGSARGGVTGVGALDALVVGAHVATATVRVGIALTVTTGYSVRFGDEAGVTLTDRVST